MLYFLHLVTQTTLHMTESALLSRSHPSVVVAKSQFGQEQSVV